MNSACNLCDDVVAETADISFGDAWVEPYTSDGKGTNVVVVRSQEINDLLQEARTTGQLQLKEVDSAFIHQTQEAGFRQRREGLSYRLTWKRSGIRLTKRVIPHAKDLDIKRRWIYRMRYKISIWSHRIRWIAHRVGIPHFYILWAKTSLAIYQGLAYQRGLLGRIWQCLGKKST
jgi:hypothetical protein